MERFTIQQCLEIVKNYYENGSSVRQTFRALRSVFGVRNRPSERTIDPKNWEFHRRQLGGF